MAGEGFLPPVVAELRGNISDLQAKMGQAREEISQTAEQGSSRLGRFSSVSRQTWSEIGGAALLAGGVMIDVSDKLEQAHARLETAVKNTGADYEDFKGKIDGVDHKMEGLGFTADKTETALGSLTTVTGDTQTAIDQMGNVADIARYKNISLGTAADLVGKLFMGQSRAAKQLGVDVDLTALKHAQGAEKLQLFGQVMDQVHNKIGGQAEAHLHTLGGEMDHYKAVVTDFIEHNGKAFGEVLSVGGMAIFGIAQIAPVAAAAVGGLSNAFSSIVARAAVTDEALMSIGTTETEFAVETEAASSMLTGVLVPALGIAGLAIGAYVLAQQLGNNETAKWKARDEEWAKGLTSGMTDVSDKVRTLTDEKKKLEAQQQKLFTSGKVEEGEYGDVAKRLSSVSGELKKAQDEQKKLADAVKAAGGDLQNGSVNLQGYGRTLSLTSERSQAFADELGIDMSQGQKSLDALGKKVEETQGKVSTAYSHMGLDGNDFANMILSTTRGGIQDAENLAKSVDKVATAYSGLGPVATTSGQELAAMGAEGKLTADQLDDIATEAQKLRDGMASSFGSATSLVQQFANQTSVSAGDINKTLADMKTNAHKWADDLAAAAKAGVDQGLLAEIAQAGPKAVPLLDGLLADVKAGNLSQINATEADIRTQLGNAQTTILGYETPFFVAGQTDGAGIKGGLSDGVAGAAGALQEALAEAVAAAHIYQYMASVGLQAGSAFAQTLSEAAAAGTTLTPGQISHNIHTHNARGSIVRNPLVSWLAEDGPEVVIPLTDPARARQLVAESHLLDLISGGSGGSVAPLASSAIAPLVGGGGGASFVWNGNVIVQAGPGMDERALARAAAREVREELLRQGRNNVNVGLG